MLTLNPDIVSQFLDRLLQYGLPFNLHDLTDHGLDRARRIGNLGNLGEQSVLEMMNITTIDHGKILAVSKFALRIDHLLIGDHTKCMI